MGNRKGRRERDLRRATHGIPSPALALAESVAATPAGPAAAGPAPAGPAPVGPAAAGPAPAGPAPASAQIPRALALVDAALVWRLPDLVQERAGDRHLLVWGDLPHWMVVDGEFLALLAALDGSTPVRTLLDARAVTGGVRDAVVAELGRLLEVGVLMVASDEDVHPSPAWEGVRSAVSLLPPRPNGDRQGTGLLPESALRDLRKPAVPSPALPDAGRSRPRLENLAINLTRRCNLRCRFCYNLDNLQTTADGELRADEFARFVKATRGLRSPDCVLTVLGGEPLLEDAKLLSVAQVAMREGLKVLVSTNGTVISEHFARQARALRLDVQVSVDGPSPALHDAVRGAGTFQRAVTGIETLVRHGVRPTVSMVCHAGNVEALGEFFAWARSVGAAEARFIPLKRMGGAGRGNHSSVAMTCSSERPASLSPGTAADPSGCDRPASFSHGAAVDPSGCDRLASRLHCVGTHRNESDCLTPVSLLDLVQRARALFEEHPEYVAMAGRDAFSVLASTCRLSTRRISCGTGLHTLLLDADGTLYPCLNTMRPELRWGNVRAPSFDLGRAWCENALLQEFRRATSIDAPSCRCRECVVRHWCLGGCKGETLSLGTSLPAPAWNCEQWRASILELFWTLAERPDLVREAARIC